MYCWTSSSSCGKCAPVEQLIVADTALAGFSSSCLQPDCSLLPSCISSLLSVSHFLRFPLQYWVNVREEKVKVHEHWYLSYSYIFCVPASSIVTLSKKQTIHYRLSDTIHRNILPLSVFVASCVQLAFSKSHKLASYATS